MESHRLYHTVALAFVRGEALTDGEPKYNEADKPSLRL